MNRDLLLDDVAFCGTVVAAVLVSLGVHDPDDPKLDFGSLDALLIEKLQDGLAIGFGLAVDSGQIVSGPL
jgi:hypothetical protein